MQFARQTSRVSEGVIIYDDGCGFCTESVEWIHDRTDLRLMGFSQLDPEEMGMHENYDKCMYLVTDDDVYACGRAAEETLKRLDGWLGKLARTFSCVPGRELVREPLYYLVAENRDTISRWT